MLQLKRQIKIFKIPKKNTWWILKLTGNKLQNQNNPGTN